LMTSHDLKRGLILADRAAILTRGVIAFQATRSELDANPFDVTYAEVTGMASMR
jgi:ABC-type proline/glycine betaine transport system ATPase subunit